MLLTLTRSNYFALVFKASSCKACKGQVPADFLLNLKLVFMIVVESLLGRYNRLNVIRN